MAEQEQAKVWKAWDVQGVVLLQATFITHLFPRSGFFVAAEQGR